jgi:hypothetical protein
MLDMLLQSNTLVDEQKQLIIKSYMQSQSNPMLDMLSQSNTLVDEQKQLNNIPNISQSNSYVYSDSNAMVTHTPSEIAELIHCRTGHPGWHALSHAIKHNSQFLQSKSDTNKLESHAKEVIENMAKNNLRHMLSKEKPCNACHQAKGTRPSFSKKARSHPADAPLYRINTQQKTLVHSLI